MEIQDIKTAVDEYHSETKNTLAELQQENKQLSGEVGEIMKVMNRPNLGNSDYSDQAEHTKAFDTWARSGRGEDELAGLERKGMSMGSDPDGGYSVPLEIDKTIDGLLRDISPIRRIAHIVQTGSADYRKLVRTSGPASGWVSELEARPVTNAVTFAAVSPPLGEIYSNPAVSQNLLDDSFFDLGDWLSNEMAENYAMEEGAAFINGTGVNQPRGFLTYDTSTDVDAARDFGTLQHLISGSVSTISDTDKLVDMVQSLRPAYRQGAVWVMNSSTLGLVRKLKGGDSAYLWQDDFKAGIPGHLLGYPVIEAEDMPDIASASLSIAFGNFDRGYTIVDRMGTRILRDPYTSKPNVLFYCTKRVGGGVINTEAIKLMKFSA